MYLQREMCSSSHQGYTHFIQNDSYLNHMGIKKPLITYTEITAAKVLWMFRFTASTRAERWIYEMNTTTADCLGDVNMIKDHKHWLNTGFQSQSKLRVYHPS